MKQERSLDFNDTFLSYQHVVDSFPHYQLKCDIPEDKLLPPFRLVFEDVPQVKNGVDDKELSEMSKAMTVQSYKIQNRGPYLENKPKK